MKKLLFTLGTLLPLPIFSQNLIQNPGVEEWEESCLFSCKYYPKFWKGNAIKSDQTPQEGQYSVELSKGKYIIYRTTTGVEAGKEYTLSYYIYDNSASKSLAHDFTWLNSNGESLSENKNQYTHSTNEGQWTEVKKIITAPENASGFYLNLKISGDNDSGMVRVDNFSLAPVQSMAVHEVSGKDIALYVENKTLHLTTTHKTTLKIINLTGQTLKYQIVNGTEKIDLSTLPKGIYLITLENQNGLYSKKIRL